MQQEGSSQPNQKKPISVNAARKLLGEDSDRLKDHEVLSIIDRYASIAEVFIKNGSTL